MTDCSGHMCDSVPGRCVTVRSRDATIGHFGTEVFEIIISLNLEEHLGNPESHVPRRDVIEVGGRFTLADGLVNAVD